MSSAWSFFGNVLEAVKTNHTFAVLWGFGVLLLIALISVLVLSRLSPWMQLPVILFTLLIIVFIFVYTVPRLPRDSRTSSYLDQVTIDLKSTDPDKRRNALKTLAASKNPVARDELAKAARNDLSDVRIEATFELARLGDRRAVPGLIGLLDGEHEKGGEAERALVKFGVLAIPHLLEALGGENAVQKKKVVNLLGEIGIKTDEVMSSLTVVLREPGTEVKRAVIDTLWKIGGPAAVSTLGEIARDRDKHKDIRIAAIRALGRIKDNQDINTVPVPTEVLEDEDLEVRKAGIGTLGEIGGPEAVRRLVKISQGDDKDTRIAAIKALGETSDTNAVLRLKEILRDVCERKFGDDQENTNTGLETVRAFTKSGLTPEAKNFLEEIWNRMPFRVVRHEIRRLVPRPSWPPCS